MVIATVMLSCWLLWWPDIGHQHPRKYATNQAFAETRNTCMDVQMRRCGSLVEAAMLGRCRIEFSVVCNDLVLAGWLSHFWLFVIIWFQQVGCRVFFLTRILHSFCQDVGKYCYGWFLLCDGCCYHNGHTFIAAALATQVMCIILNECLVIIGGMSVRCWWDVLSLHGKTTELERYAATQEAATSMNVQRGGGSG